MLSRKGVGTFPSSTLPILLIIAWKAVIVVVAPTFIDVHGNIHWARKRFDCPKSATNQPIPVQPRQKLINAIATVSGCPRPIAMKVGRKFTKRTTMPSSTKNDRAKAKTSDSGPSGGDGRSIILSQWLWLNLEFVRRIVRWILRQHKPRFGWKDEPRHHWRCRHRWLRRDFARLNLAAVHQYFRVLRGLCIGELLDYGHQPAIRCDEVFFIQENTSDVELLGRFPLKYKRIIFRFCIVVCLFLTLIVELRLLEFFGECCNCRLMCLAIGFVDSGCVSLGFRSCLRFGVLRIRERRISRSTVISAASACRLASSSTCSHQPLGHSSSDISSLNISYASAAFMSLVWCLGGSLITIIGRLHWYA